MCGIAGYSNDKTGAASALVAAQERLSHRGPDDAGIFVDPQVHLGLVHTRLSILDVSPSGHQPMASQCGRYVLVFNGEIYNFRELRAELQARGANFRGQADTEVLLNLYLVEGEAMLARLNGIFALAVWDAERQELLLARDALGVKPLYFTAEPGHFAFASELKALLPIANINRDLDPAALQRYLTFLWCPGEGTPLQAIRKLLPGEAMVVRAGKIERRWAWYRLPAFRHREISARGPDSAVKGTIKHLRNAVHRQLAADVPIGAFLSGGLDSSAIVALAREQIPDIRCFTIETQGGQEAGATDDLPYARRVARHLGVPLEVVCIDASRMVGDLEQMVAQLDEPLADPAPLNVLYISELARKHGVKVLLSGAGGDDIFTGYRRHRARMAERWWSWLPTVARRGLMAASGRLDQQNPLSRRVAKAFSGAALDGDQRLVNYFRWIKRADLDRLYSPAFRQALGKSRAETPMLQFLKDLPATASPLERMLALEQRFFLADHNLLYTDKMSMAVGVEVRVPFLDLELVEFASRIPAKFKQVGLEGKWVLKKAMEPYLPRDVIYRPKSGFGAPLRRWMRHELRQLLGDLLSEESIRRRGLFEPAAVQRLIADNDHGYVDASYTLLSLLCIEIWCRKFVDNFGVADFGVAASRV